MTECLHACCRQSPRAESDWTGGGSTLVGRQPQMNTIVAAMERSISGRGHVVRVVGVPGIGKSRLVSESVALARSRGADVCVISAKP